MNSLQPVLLVEDDVVDAMIVKRCFKELKIPNELIVAVNGRVAFDILLESKQTPNPCIVLLDINMPIMNGLEFLEKFKNHQYLLQIPVVMLTSSIEEKDIQQCYQMGIAGYMVKSIDYEHFVKSIGLLNNYWSMSELPK